MGFLNRGNKENAGKLPPMVKPKTQAEKDAEAAAEEKVTIFDKQGNPIQTTRGPSGLYDVKK